MSLAVSERLIASSAVLHHSLSKSALPLTSKLKTQVTARDNNPDFIQLLAQQLET
jgi:hypothetical protein